MKKIILSILLAITFSANSFANQTQLNLQEEFKYDQEQALVQLVDSWLRSDSEKVLISNFMELIRANNRYRLSLLGPDQSVVAYMMKAAAVETSSSIDKVNLAVVEYFKQEKSINIDTRSCFSKTPYQIKN